MAQVTEVGRLVYSEKAGSRSLRPEDLWLIPRVGSPAVAPDGTRLVLPVTNWPDAGSPRLTQLWLMQSDGSQCRRLTGDRCNVDLPRWSPDGRQLVYVGTPREGGNALPQLFLMSLDGGEPDRLCEFPLGVMDVRWLPDGSGLVIVSKLIVGHLTVEQTKSELARRAEDPVKVQATERRLFRFWDQWLTGDEVPHFFHLDLESGSCRDLTPNSTAWLDFMSPADQFDLSPDGTELVFAGLVMNDELNEVESRIFRVGIESGEMQCLTDDATAGCVRPRYAPDGQIIAYGRKEDRYFYADRPRLYRYFRDTQSHELWCGDWDQAPESWEFTSDGALVFTAEDSARTHLYSLASELAVPGQLAKGGTIRSPQVASDGCIYFTRQSFHQPPEIFRLRPGSESPEQITWFTADFMREISLGEVREFECVGSGGETIQSYIMLPPGHQSGTPAPFVNVVHGGPHGVWGDEFHFRWNAQVFAARGYVVAFPNPQGSTSWGNDFAQRIQGAWSERPYADVMAVTDRLIDCGLVDANRMAAAGGSYGGYMMAWIAGQTSRFRCLVNHAGVYNTLSMYASDATQGRGRSFGGEPWTDLNAIDASNPARFTAKMTTPMLVIHGEQDYRVPVTQGLECYGVLQAKGVPSRLVYFPDENHWILKPHNSIRWHQEVFDWIACWLEQPSS